MKKFKKGLLIFILLFIFVNFVAVHVDASAVIKSYSKIINKYFDGMVKIVQPDEMTYELMTHRKNKYVVIEIDIGIVKNNKKDGEILNVTNPNFGRYICYKRVKKAKKGDKIISIFVYNNTNYFDGCEADIRIDRIIK